MELLFYIKNQNGHMSHGPNVQHHVAEGIWLQKGTVQGPAMAQNSPRKRAGEGKPLSGWAAILTSAPLGPAGVLGLARSTVENWGQTHVGGHVKTPKVGTCWWQTDFFLQWVQICSFKYFRMSIIVPCLEVWRMSPKDHVVDYTVVPVRITL